MSDLINFWRRKVAQDPYNDEAVIELANVLTRSGYESKYDIERVLIASTAHITEEENSWLRLMSESPQGQPLAYEYGFEFWVPPADILDDVMEEYDYPENVVRLIKKASELGCAYLKIDVNGLFYDEFPIYDW